MTRAEAISALRAVHDNASADTLANVTDGELDGIVKAKGLGYAPRNPGAWRERDVAVLAAFAAAGG